MDIRERVINIIAEQLGEKAAKLTDETTFIKDLGADSLDLVELVMELEEEFDISIPDEQAELVLTVGQAVALVTKLSEES